MILFLGKDTKRREKKREGGYSKLEHSFDTNLPPLSERELQQLTDQEKNKDVSSYDQTDVDVYDFATLRDELGAHEDVLLEDDDHLGDQLIEEGDINNDITFADAPVGKFLLYYRFIPFY